MNRILWVSSVALATAACLTACGDEVTEVTTTGVTSVAKFKDLGECTAKNDGELVYVKDSAAVFLCADSVWNVLSPLATNASEGSDVADGKDGKNGANGKDGKDGENGTSCTAKALKDKSGFELSCGGKVVGTISNGTNGLKGEDGASCEGKENEDGSVTISCGGDEVATIKNGVDGKSAFELSGFEGTEEEWIASLKGEPGTSCTIIDDDDGVVTLQCGTGDDAKTTKLYKAMCGAESYDPEMKICDNESGKLLTKCGKDDKTGFDPETHFCYDEAVGQAMPFCAGKTYTTLEFCYQGNGVYPKCGDKLSPYNPNEKICVNNKIMDRCGDVGYDPENQMCDKRNLKVYGFVTIGSGEKAQVWMTQNLNYYDPLDPTLKDNSWCYEATDGDQKTENCDKYGRHYTWAAAVGKTREECGAEANGYCFKDDYRDEDFYVRGVCPDGWHVPSVTDWKTLAINVDPSINGVWNDSNHASTPLKSNTDDWRTGRGTDDYSFSALPLDYRSIEGGWGRYGDRAYFWTSVEVIWSHSFYVILPTEHNMIISNSYKDHGFNVRCIKDKD